MAQDGRTPGVEGRTRPRKPTPAERREQRGTVEDPAEVLDAAARFLEARPRSVTEVRRKLSRLGYRPELVAGTLDRLAELGFLDDEAFARAWVEARDRAKPRGEHALRRELGMKGVDRSLVDGVLDDRRDDAAAAAEGLDDPPTPDEAAAERLLRRKLPAILREPDLRKRRYRAYALLARSGFAPDVCGSVSKRLLDEANLDEANLDEANAEPDDEFDLDGDAGAAEP